MLEEAELRAQEIFRDACGEAEERLLVIQAEARESYAKIEQARQALEWQTSRLRTASEMMAQMAAEMEELTAAGNGDVIDLPQLMAEGVGEPF